MLAKGLLALVTTAIPVFIAACYGAPAGDRPDTSKPGRVSDSLTQQPIAGIEVRCMRGADLATAAWSDAEGVFELYYDPADPCDTVLATDTDGATNGTYVDTEIAFDEAATEIVIELDPAE